MDVLAEAATLLIDAGYDAIDPIEARPRHVGFENDTVMGFVLAFDSPSALLREWEGCSDQLLNSYRFALRHGNKKAWNVYTVFLARGCASSGDTAVMAGIEENLVGTRKIARAIEGIEDLRNALLPLLPFQNSPRLEEVNFRHEIELRCQELPTRAVKAFLSGDSETVVLPVLEEEP
jgi:hypothetical protein